MGDGYEYDLFLSYKRAGNVPGWIEHHFYPLLNDALTDLRPVVPRIFLDTQQEIGVRWPDNLANALQRSRYMVAVWSVPYFESAWCMAEWKSMLMREELLGIGGKDNPLGLVYPVVFADGDSFPKEARDVQARMDLKRWAVPFPGFRETPAYLEFFQAVREVAETLAARLDQAPAWRPDWPVVRPPPTPPVRLPQPRL
jgi:TIR domain